MIPGNPPSRLICPEGRQPRIGDTARLRRTYPDESQNGPEVDDFRPVLYWSLGWRWLPDDGLRKDLYGTRDSRGVAVFHAPAARIAAWRFRNDGAPARNHGAIMLSNIMQPNAELGMNGQMGLPHR